MATERYTLLQRIGIGGMAEVWKATSQGAAGFRKTVAIKTVLPKVARDPELVRRFIGEAQVVAQLVHPNIVQVFDFGELEPGTYFIAMEYVAGASAFRLASELEKTGRRFPPEIALHIALEIAKGLGHAHSRRPAIIHCDVSPQNVLVSFEGEVKLADFGIAKIGADTEQPAEFEGKLGYSSPEQARAGIIDLRSDLFSLGVTLYRLITAKELFRHGNFTERLTAAAEFRGLTPSLLAPVPEAVRPIVERALQVDPANRYQNAEEMEADLSECLDLSSTIMTRRTLATLTRQCFPEQFRREMAEQDAYAGTSATGPIPAAGFGMPETQLATSIGAAPDDATIPPPSAEPTIPPVTPYAAAPPYEPTVQTSRTGPLSPVGAPAAERGMLLPLVAAAAVGALVVGGLLTQVDWNGTHARDPIGAAASSATPSPRAPKIVRSVPAHPAMFLDGCSAAEIERVTSGVNAAIRDGVPLFNQGDVAGCFALYRERASALRADLPATCPGPRDALQQGLDRAETLPTPLEKAWAMRDAFDGLLTAAKKPRASN